MEDQLEATVRRANELSSAALADLLSPAGDVGGRDGKDRPIRRQVWAAPELSDETKDSLWNLFDTNMTALAAGTSLATPKSEKMEEMFDPAARYITYLSIDDESLLGFASFRFDTENTLDSQEYADGARTTVVYIYEMQVASSARGHGLGTRLLADCESLAKRTGMQKTMLTCLKKNERALEFYQRNGQVVPLLRTRGTD